MSNTRPNNTTKFLIDNQERELNKDGELQEETFKIQTKKKGQPLLSGIINKPVVIQQNYTGISLTGNADEIIAALNNKPRRA